MPFHIKSNIDGLIAKNKRRIAKMTPYIVIAEVENMQDIKKEAIKNTSYTAYVLHSQDPIYPYSHRDNSPPMAPYFANMQSGAMAKSWEIKTIPTYITIESSIWNTQPYSRFFDGSPTSKMIARDIMGYILYKTNVRMRRLKRLHEAHLKYLADN